MHNTTNTTQPTTKRHYSRGTVMLDCLACQGWHAASYWGPCTNERERFTCDEVDAINGYTLGTLQMAEAA